MTVKELIDRLQLLAENSDECILVDGTLGEYDIKNVVTKKGTAGIFFGGTERENKPKQWPIQQ